MRKPVPALVLSDEQRGALIKVSRSTVEQHRNVLRAKALLAAAQGRANTAVAAELGVSPATVAAWRDGFTSDGMDDFGVVRAGRGRKAGIDEMVFDRIVFLTMNTRASTTRGFGHEGRSGVRPVNAQQAQEMAASEMRRLKDANRDPIDILLAGLPALGDGLTPFSFVVALYAAFDVPVRVLHDVADWYRLSDQGKMSDEAVAAILAPWLPSGP